jgi:hypothetical protein
MVVGTLLDGVTSLGSKIFDLTRAMTKAGDALQKASLALGSDFRTMNTQLKPSMDGLRGSIEQRFGAAFATFEAGLQGNTAGISKLINQQQLTGTQYQQTAKAFAKLEFALDLSREESNELANRVRLLGAEFNVSTDKLVESIADLKSTFPAQRLAGMGAETMEAVATLRAEIPALGEELNSVLRMIFDPSMGTMGKLSILGIENARTQLANNKDVNSQVSILKNAISTAAGTVENLTKGSSNFFPMISVVTGAVGETATLFPMLNDELERRLKNPDPMLDFGKTIEVLKAEVFVPFKMFFLDQVFPVLVEVADVLSFIGQELTASFTRLFPTLDLTTENLKIMKIGILEFSIKFINAFEGVTNIMVHFGSKVLPALVDAIVGVANFINSMDIFKSPERKAKEDELHQLMGHAATTGAITEGNMTAVTAGVTAFLAGKVGIGGFVKNIPFLGEMGNIIEGAGKADTEFTKADMFKMANLVRELEPISTTGMPKFEEAMLNIINADDSQLIKNLKGALIELKLGNDLSIARNDSLEDMNRKTIDPFEQATTSDYLNNQSVGIGRVMESILGITPQSDEERTALMQAQTQYLKAIAEKPSGLFANPLGY